MAEMDDAFGVWKKTPTPDNAASLLNTASPVLDRALTTYAGRSNPILKAQAKSLALDAFKTYDPKRGAKLRTHLMIQLQPLRREAIKSSLILRMPERMAYDRRALDDATSEFSSMFNRDPNDMELADKTGLSVKRIRMIRAQQPAIVSTQLGEDLDVPVKDTRLGDIWMDYVYHELDPVDKSILDWRLGQHGAPKLSNNEIARRLKITASAVSQRTGKIIARLQEGEKLEL